MTGMPMCSDRQPAPLGPVTFTPLRFDDIGASSKRWERHRGKWFPYRELGRDDYADLAYWLRKYGSRCTLAVTACWVERDATLTSFDRKYPEAARTIRWMVESGLVEIACHGLTHCIPGRHLPPRLPWRGNRRWHREFIDLVPHATQVWALREARERLEQMFLTRVDTFVPPGNAVSERMALTALDMGFHRVTCRLLGPDHQTLKHEAPRHGTEGITCDCLSIVLHDRDLVSHPDTMAKLRHRAPFCTVEDYYKESDDAPPAP